MDKTEFYEKVAEMRLLQKQYFKTRQKEVLQKSKEVERKVDDEIKKFFNPELF